MVRWHAAVFLRQPQWGERWGGHSENCVMGQRNISVDGTEFSELNNNRPNIMFFKIVPLTSWRSFRLSIPIGTAFINQGAYSNCFITLSEKVTEPGCGAGLQHENDPSCQQDLLISLCSPPWYWPRPSVPVSWTPRSALWTPSWHLRWIWATRSSLRHSARPRPRFRDWVESNIVYSPHGHTMTCDDHIKPVLQQLHWLPVEQRIKCKLLFRSVALSVTSVPSVHVWAVMGVHVSPPEHCGQTPRAFWWCNGYVQDEVTGTIRWLVPRFWNMLPVSVKQTEWISRLKLASKPI